MTKKRSKRYQPKPVSHPMLVTRKLEENIEAMNENAMLTAFQYGVATKEHYDYLVQMGNLLNIASQKKELKATSEYVAHLMSIVKSILDRYHSKGKLGVAGEELMRLREFVRDYQQFWIRQTTTFYNECVYELNAFYGELEERRKAA